MLIYPPLTVEERYGRRVGKTIGGDLPPLGIASLAAFVLEKGFTVDVVDALALDLDAEGIAERIAVINPRVVGFSALTVGYHRARLCAQALRDRFPDLLILIGGHHATIAAGEILDESSSFDLAVMGEGELTLAEILERFRAANWRRSEFLSSEAALSEIAGIAYRAKAGTRFAPPREPIANLDVLPFPARHLLPMAKYLPLPNQYLRPPVVHMTAIRGCPYKCAFCSNNAVFGRHIRVKSPGRIVDEIQHVMRAYGAREISFWDDTMTVRRAWMDAFCDELMGRGVDIVWTAYARVDTVDPDILKKMKKAGCWNLFYGFETGSQELLDLIDKGVTIEQIRQANRWTQEAGIEVRGSFMLALPGETPELARKTIRFAVELDCDYAQFCITTPFPGTRLHELASHYGRLSHDLGKYHIWEPVFVPSGYRDEQEILDMEKLAIRKFYLRPGFVLKCLRKIRSVEDIRRYIKGARMLLGFV